MIICYAGLWGITIIALRIGIAAAISLLALAVLVTIDLAIAATIITWTLPTFARAAHLEYLAIDNAGDGIIAIPSAGTAAAAIVVHRIRTRAWVWLRRWSRIRLIFCDVWLIFIDIRLVFVDVRRILAFISKGWRKSEGGNRN